MAKRTQKSPLLTSLRGVLGRKRKILAPQKRNPEEYHKQIWLPLSLHKEVLIVIPLMKLNYRQTALKLIAIGVVAYMGGLVAEYVDKRRKGPYKRPPREIQLLRQYMKDHGIENPRIDNGYRVI